MNFGDGQAHLGEEALIMFTFLLIHLYGFWIVFFFFSLVKIYIHIYIYIYIYILVIHIICGICFTNIYNTSLICIYMHDIYIIIIFGGMFNMGDMNHMGRYLVFYSSSA